MNDPHRKPFRHLFQSGDQEAIRLDREDLGSGGRERNRQRAEAGADLQEPRAGPRPGVANYGPGRVGIGEEVLAERLPRADAVALGKLDQRALGEGPTR